ncbi:MAG: histidinol-phosphatase [Sphingomonadaceae bacterium]|uniref:histidinol-phosphatase n=1 Tax=Thermaurantiacus sp. TaxID=2820283 RepID=UPI00298F33D0|nr:histidinol-phosphatase [Thermaurantiacus sp.]MCS6987780.1 histidinol-phosphatase [Sphingomonadaceae bacterium]MDW8415000.1 histidinol-phosphatase [Thermaurantiacus sp.]
MHVEPDLVLANRLADAAGEVIRPLFRTAVEATAKPDRSPVTRADRAAEDVMRRILASDRPRDGIIGEEFGQERPGASRIWVLDPIDGTRAFLAGRPLFGTLIALLVDGAPVLGVIDQPILKERWVGQTAAGGATLLNGRKVRVRACPGLSAARLATTSPWHFSGAGHAAFGRIARLAADTILGGDCFNYAMLASGHLDLVVEEGLKVHDWAALVPVVAGAGGIITDWRGRPLRLGAAGDVIAAGDRRVHAQALERM